MDELPVDAVRPLFEEAMADPSRPIVVTAPTGSGKSTRLPLWMAEARPGLALVVEPRRVACRALATYLAKQAGERVGDRIGYAVRFDQKRSEKTRVLFVTPGVALRMLADQAIEPGALLIDEFHERGWAIDLIATLALERRAHGAALPFIVTSATLESAPLARRLDARLIEAQGRTFPVEIEYAGGAPAPTREGLAERVARAVLGALEREPGEALVFLPGKAEIAACRRELEPKISDDVRIVPVHASLPGDQLSRALGPAQAGERRVFLATNVAETSLTLSGVTWVIDSGLARMQIHRAGRTALALVAISQASMDQRAGRAGRVRPGHCIRLWERAWAPKPETPPEIKRAELDDLIVRAAACGLEGEAFDRAHWVSEPPAFAVENARRRLASIGALDRRGRLTERGQALATLPVSAYEARLLVDLEPAMAGTMADLVALMQRPGSLLLPDRALSDPERVLEARRALFLGVRDEVSEALVALRRAEAARHGARRAALAELRRLAAQLRAHAGAPEADPRRDRAPLPTPDQLAALVLRRAPELGFVLRARAERRRARAAPERARSEPWANGEVELMVEPYRAWNEEDRYAPEDRPSAGALLGHAWIGEASGYGVRGRGSLLLPCAPATLAQSPAAEIEIGEARPERRRGRLRVTAPVRRVLAGVTLSSEPEELRGAPLIEAAAGLILANRLVKGTLARLCDALFFWDLLHHWRPTPSTEHWPMTKLKALGEAPEPTAYLIERLAELGLERAEEIDLLSPDDLIPDLSAMSGLPHYELSALAELFPRTWTHLGATYAVRVDPGPRRVTLEPANKEARRRGEPPTEVLPRFEQFRVVYKQASRVVTLRGGR